MGVRGGGRKAEDGEEETRKVDREGGQAFVEGGQRRSDRGGRGGRLLREGVVEKGVGVRKDTFIATALSHLQTR